MNKLYRLPQQAKLAGVCAGLSEHFGIDPTVMRIVVVALALVTGFFPTAIAYAVVAWITPVRLD